MPTSPCYGHRYRHAARIHLLRYDVAVDRVVAYVPLLAKLALETLDPGAATRKITSRHGDRLPIQVCLDAARREQEVIADVSGLAPEVLAFETDLKGKDFYHSIGDIQTGRFQTGKQYLDAYRSQGYGRLADSDQEMGSARRCGAACSPGTAPPDDQFYRDRADRAVIARVDMLPWTMP